MSMTKYVNDDRWLEELFMTFATGMVEEQRKIQKSVEEMTEILGKMVELMKKMGRMSARLAKARIEIEATLKEMRQEMGKGKRKREVSEARGSRSKKRVKKLKEMEKGEDKEELELED